MAVSSHPSRPPLDLGWQAGLTSQFTPMSPSTALYLFNGMDPLPPLPLLGKTTPKFTRCLLPFSLGMRPIARHWTQLPPRFTFHYLVESGIYFLTLTDKGYPKKLAFQVSPSFPATFSGSPCPFSCTMHPYLPPRHFKPCQSSVFSLHIRTPVPRRALWGVWSTVRLPGGQRITAVRLHQVWYVSHPILPAGYLGAWHTLMLSS